MGELDLESNKLFERATSSVLKKQKVGGFIWFFLKFFIVLILRTRFVKRNTYLKDIKVPQNSKWSDFWIME